MRVASRFIPSTNRTLRFETRQVRAETKVRAATERQVFVRLPSNVEAIRIGKRTRVTVGRRQERPHAGVLRKRLATELGVGVEHPHGEPDRPVETQALLDRSVDQRGIRLQPSELVGMKHELPDAVPDQPDRGLEACDQKTDRLRDELLAAQAIALLLRPNERAQKIVAEPRAALGDQHPKVLAEVVPREAGAREHVRWRDLARETVRGVGGPDGELLAIVERHADHLADDRGWHRQRQVGNDVHRAAARDAIETVVDDTLHVTAQALHRTGREGAADQTTEARMVRRVLLQHEPLLTLQRLVHEREYAVGGSHPGRHSVQHPPDILVPR